MLYVKIWLSVIFLFYLTITTFKEGGFLWLNKIF